MFSKKFVFAILFVTLVLNLGLSQARSYKRRYKKEKPKQIYDTRETNAPNFIRLLLMRLVYGFAAQMGAEERVADVFNGALVPPNAEDDYFDLDSEELDEVFAVSFF